MEHGATLRAERWEVIDKLSRQYAKPLVAMRAQAFFSPIEQFSWLLNLGVLLSLCDGWVQWVCSDEAGSGPMGANEKRVETNPSPSDRSLLLPGNAPAQSTCPRHDIRNDSLTVG